MLKHIKTYENYNPEIVGKYVICTDTFSKDKRVLNFINSNIGKCIDYTPPGEKNQEYYVVEYSDVSLDLKDDFTTYETKIINGLKRNFERKNCYIFFENEIIEYSDSIEYL